MAWWNKIIENAQSAANNRDFIDGRYGNVFGRWLYPGAAQEEEFGQQMAYQEWMNDYNTPQHQMERMIAAGINPNTAAAGIAGAGNQAAPVSAPNSAIGAGAAGMSAAAGVGEALNNAADIAGNKVAQFAKLGLEKENLRASTAQLLEQAGLNHWEAMSISELLPDMKAEKKADIYLKIAEREKVIQEYQNLTVEYDKKWQEIEEIKQNVVYLKQLGDVAQATEQEILARTKEQEVKNWFAEEDKKLWQNHGYRMDDPIDCSLRNSMINGKTDAAATIGQAIETGSNRAALGSLSAESEFAYTIANARKNGENASDVAYGRIGSMADLCGRIADLGADGILNLGQDITNWAKSRRKAPEIRSELTMVLSNAYDQLENYPDDAERLNKVITDINCALSLSNKELVDWYNKNWK